ncbi:caspase family protein [Myroides odoratimimus]|uniref:caspase family protein n=1 Tax=Myroides odoratimimus TaxID=76832 RepID=UPI00257663D9|nr:caspase family protein [Myroides odoratimimus]MDM1521568.1 caspase family protein [Myroides odoratimimus]
MKKALIIGINNYPKAPLTGCGNDAYAMKSILDTNGDGSPNFDIELKLDVSTKSELKTLVINLFNGDADIALLYLDIPLHTAPRFH